MPALTDSASQSLGADMIDERRCGNTARARARGMRTPRPQSAAQSAIPHTYPPQPQRNCGGVSSGDRSSKITLYTQLDAPPPSLLSHLTTRHSSHRTLHTSQSPSPTRHTRRRPPLTLVGTTSTVSTVYILCSLATYVADFARPDQCLPYCCKHTSRMHAPRAVAQHR